MAASRAPMVALDRGSGRRKQSNIAQSDAVNGVPTVDVDLAARAVVIVRCLLSAGNDYAVAIHPDRHCRD